MTKSPKFDQSDEGYSTGQCLLVMLVPYNGGVGEGGSFDECVDDFLVWQFK